MKKIVASLLIASQLSTAMADAMQNSYDQSKVDDENAALSIQSTDSFQAYSPESYAGTEGENLQQDGYYDDSSTLESAAIREINNNPLAADVMNVFVNQKNLYSADSPTMKKLNLVQRNAYEITHGISNDVFDCESGSYCQTVFEERSCQISNNDLLNCTIKPVISPIYLVYKTQVTRVRARYYLTPNIPNYGGGSKFHKDGVIKQVGFAYGASGLGLHPGLTGIPQGVSLFENPYTVIFDGQYIQTSYNNGTNMSTSQILNIPVSDIQDYSIEFVGRFPFQSANIEITEVYPVEKRDITWKEDCPLAKTEELSCTQEEKSCVEGAETRIIDGSPIYLSCWEYSQPYTCGRTPIDTCEQYSGVCDLQSFVCSDKVGNFCFEYNRSYSCPVKKCEEQQVSCLEPVFCLDGECDEIEDPEAEYEEFAKSVSTLAAVVEAAEDVSEQTDENNITIFTGQSVDCGKSGQGLYNCCGKDDPLIMHNCNDQEKMLSEAQSKNIAIRAGEYCKTKFLGVCLSKHEGWCVFDSELAKIIQAQGRQQQLGISFGSGESPNCRGLKPEELQQVNFDQVDFSEFYDEMEAGIDLPDTSELQQSIADRINAKYGAQ